MGVCALADKPQIISFEEKDRHKEVRYLDVLTAEYHISGVYVVQYQKTRSGQIQTEQSGSCVLDKHMQNITILTGDTVVNGAIEERQVLFR